MVSNNVLLITIDSLRADALPDGEVAPVLTELGESGVRFTQAVSNGPNTISSFPSILTGTHGPMYGGREYMNEDRPFLAETLGEASYTTVGYHSNPHLGIERNFNTGFDVFNDGMEQEGGGESPGRSPFTRDRLFKTLHRRLDTDGRLYRLLRRAWHIFSSTTGATKYTPAKKLTEDALNWLDDSEEPFFMWLQYMDVHYPFHPPKRYLREIGYEVPSARRIARLNGLMLEDPDSLTESDIEDLRALYRGELRYLDEQLGRLIDALEADGLLEETLVIVTSDHGEAFGEHDLWGHPGQLYDVLLRVPLIVHDPNSESSIIDRQVSLIDLFPTLCDACDIDRPDELQGRNLFDDGEELAIASAGRNTLAARTPEWKCLWSVEEDQIELYDLEADPEELTDVSEEHPETVERLQSHMEDFREAVQASDASLPSVDESEEARERLEALGYVD